MRQRDAGIRLGCLAFQQQARAQRSHFERRRIAAAGRGIGHLELANLLPDEFVGQRCSCRFELARPAQRHRQVEALVANVRGDVDRRRQWIVVRHPEGGAVRKDPCQAPQPDLADLQEVAFELELGEAPAVWHESLASRLDVPLEIAVLLLKVLRLQEQPLGPDDAVMGRHGRVPHNLHG